MASALILTACTGGTPEGDGANSPTTAPANADQSGAGAAQSSNTEDGAANTGGTTSSACADFGKQLIQGIHTYLGTGNLPDGTEDGAGVIVQGNRHVHEMINWACGAFGAIAGIREAVGNGQWDERRACTAYKTKIDEGNETWGTILDSQAGAPLSVAASLLLNATSALQEIEQRECVQFNF